ncbi:MAG: DNA-3-methyladenine glycosylase 2 family protein [Gammaproteobacteria bacterium]
MDKRVIKRGMSELAKVDQDIARALAQIGLPEPRLRPAGFETLFTTLLSQQISVEAARAIRERVVALMGEITPQAVLKVKPEALREAGMSYRKIEYAQGLAQTIMAGTLDVDDLKKQSDAAVIDAISAVRGFGVWSAEIYLMFSLRRRDVFPAGDLALRLALGKLKGMNEKLTEKEARNTVEHWAPWRSVGAIFLWHYYRGAPE